MTVDEFYRRFWHRHPLDAVEDHVRIAEPAIEDVIADLVTVSENL
jgi:hypothetical protein